MRTTHTDTRSANRADRRAAARGKDLPATPGLLPHERKSGRSLTKPVHSRADYAARRSG
ncbi:MAG: hypothetical protein OJJ54_08060 [Pseudonocardia sp.]|nr:hypothetical protein [Pseudonocardia sp.]